MLDGVQLDSFVKWLETQTPLTRKTLAELKNKKYSSTKIGVASHIEPKMLPLFLDFKRRGVEFLIAPCVPGIAHRESFKYLREQGVETFGETTKSWSELEKAWGQILKQKPNFLFDIGGGLIQKAAKEKYSVVAGCEATSTGIENIKDTKLSFPVFDWNNIPFKNWMHNRYEVGSGVWYAFRHLTGLDICRLNVGVIGFGQVGQSVASIAKGLGARVYICDNSLVREMSAASEGYNTGTLEEIIPHLDVLVTATGLAGIVRGKYLKTCRDGLLIASAGHDSREIDLSDLKSQGEVIPQIERFSVDKKHVYLLSGGKLLNLAAGGGSALNTFDLVTALIVRVMHHMLTVGRDAPAGLQPLPAGFGDDLLEDALLRIRES